MSPTLPPGRIFIPPALRKKLLTWVHACRFAGHSNVTKTLKFLQKSYWWPAMKSHVQEFIVSCIQCTQHKTDRQTPAGSLKLLPLPSRPWMHISIDFITDLPVSQGHNAIWVVVDRFSKMAHFVPLTGLPSAAKLVQLFLREIF